ncbi:glycosyltransferase [Pectobacterium brasiliense]|uniref:glycosyltransferase n=1 Tax=Pectobacterium brasiliense TaxID=180957 RepID=UPI00202D212A|nr:glycosyltransferase [Pectobacterium brasiliense]MCL6378270.1 glycosyltransferase [Pectobacterium brasiliense]
MIFNKKLGCLIIYESDEYKKNLSIILKAVDTLLIVDNSKEPIATETKENVVVINNYNKGGVAGAINLAFNYARDNDFLYMLLLDQDTIIEEYIVDRLIEYLIKINDAAIVGPKYVNSFTKKPGMFVLDKNGFPVPSRLNGIKNPKKSFFIINSGTLINIKKIPKLVIYDESFYVDCVDIDFCLQLRKENLSSYIIPTVVISHGIGNKDNNESYLTPTNYSDNRYILLSRSKKTLWKKWFLTYPVFIIFDIFIFSLDVFRSFVFSPRRFSVLKMIVKGFIGKI